MSTPRVNTAPTVWTPYLRKPVRVAFSSTLTQLYQRFSCVWWAKPSNWVPTWPISEMTISSFEPRRFEGWFMKVRLMCTSKRRVPKNGILSESTWPSSITSPVLMSFAAFITAAAVWRFIEPRSSVAPHLNGQRWLSGGGDQVGAWARAAVAANSDPPSAAARAFMESLPRLYGAPVDVPGERRMRPLRDGGKTGGGAA